MIRRFFNRLMVFGVLVICLSGFSLTQPVAAQEFSRIHFHPTSIIAEELRNPVDTKLGTEYGSKVDLNNSNIQAFIKHPGLYPTLARKIIENAPFENVEQVFDMPGLSQREIEILKLNLDNFVVTRPEPALIEGGDRINPGVYR